MDLDWWLRLDNYVMAPALVAALACLQLVSSLSPACLQLGRSGLVALGLAVTQVLAGPSLYSYIMVLAPGMTMAGL